MVGALSHVKSNTIADFTGTFTGFNSQGSTITIAATDLVRPSDWNSVHNQFLTMTGNTAVQSTASGSKIVLAADDLLQWKVSQGAGVATISAEMRHVSGYIPYPPSGSSISTTFGATGTSSASALFYPFQITNPVDFNALRLFMNFSFITSTVSGRQTISSAFGIYTRTGDTLSQLSSGSFSFAVTNSSVSATVTFPGSTNTAGYTMTSSSGSTTAQLQSLFGNNALKAVDLVFGNTMSLSVGQYWFGAHVRQSSSSANVGIVPALNANFVSYMQNAGPMGAQASSFWSDFTNYHIGDLLAFQYTSTGPYGGSTLPASAPLSQGLVALNNVPIISFVSTG